MNFDLFQYLGAKKLNELIITGDYVTGSTTVHDITKGPDSFSGMLGMEYEFTEKKALKLSNTIVGTLYGCIIKLVRIDPSQSGALSTWVVGRPVYWSNKQLNYCTTQATLTSQLAGIAITAPGSSNAKGDITPIVVYGDVGVLLAASLTKAAPVANDLVSLSIGSSLATADVLADATAATHAMLAAHIGRVGEAWTGAAGTVKKMHLTNAIRLPWQV